jgi:hypothetical protein
MGRSWSWPCRIQNEGEFLVENSGQDVLKGTPFWQRINLKSTLENRRTGAAIAFEATSAATRSRNITKLGPKYSGITYGATLN